MGRKEFLESHADLRQKCLVYSRCMGYYRPVKDYNTGKQSEFRERVFYRVKNQGC